MKIVVGVLYTLLPEIILLVIAMLLAHYAVYFPDAGILATELVALFILIASLALSMQFNRSRIFFALLTLLIGYGALLALAGAHDGLSRQILDGGLCLFLPLNLVFVHSLAERGVFTRYGAWPFGLLLLEIAFVIVLMGRRAQGVAGALFVKFLQWPMLSLTGISQPGLLLLIIGLLWINDRLIRRHSAEIAAFFFSMVATAVMLNSQQPVTVAIFAAAAALAFGLAIVLESWSMAYLDELTGLPGRRALEEHMRQLGGRYVIAMLDVDHFKHFNDTYGHDVGDQVLRLVASRLQQCAGSGKAFRYGGEEFGLLFPGKSLKETASALEALRTDIETSGFNPRRGERRAGPDIQDSVDDGNPLRVTVSIGAAESSTSRGDPWGVLKTADQALYDAKHNGRNRVCVRGI
ncbi:MAG TPA: GGDEF domain-containing protein [Gammaproteobacteria bacterium]|nr:GGDEF domain-containing protein [Gammaproteobacteria bacterium]